MNILSDPANGGSDSDTGDLNTITINEDFAKRYNHNKKREDLQRYDEYKLKKLIHDEFTDNQEYDDSSGDDDEEDDVIKFDPKHEVQFVDALLKIRNNDPVLRNKEVKLFDDVASDDDDVADNKKKKDKKKKVYLKDVNANMLLENGADFADDVSDDDVEMEKKMREKSFVEKMAESKKEFLDAVGGAGEGDEDDGEIFKVKDSGKGEEDEDEDEVEYEKKLDEYFANDDKLNEDDKGFLRDYFGKKMWLGKDDGNDESNEFDDGFDIDVSDDDEIMARQEDYEREINFRHQEGGEDHVTVHPRKILDSVRKVESKRGRQRESKKEREEEKRRETMEEIKRLKNVKKEDMNEKLKKFREIAGILDGEDCVLDEGDLEGDFDPEEYDRKMKKAFDDKFYNAKDADPNFASDEDDEDGEMEKPNFDEEDELLGLLKGWDDKFRSGDGFTATREKVLKKKVKSDIVEEEEEDEEEPEIKEGKKKRKRKSSKLEEEFIKKQLEEFYKLDCEDTIGDLKTRFKYKPVKENNYGLKAKDILVVDDKELNQLIPLKKLATYREDEFHVPYKKIKETKQRIRAQRRGESSKGDDNGGKRSKNDAGKPVKQVADDAEIENPESETQNEGEKKQSRKQRRKLRLQELKLAPTRRMAYNLDVPKKKKKDKTKA